MMVPSLQAPHIFLLITLSLLALFSSIILTLQTKSLVFVSQYGDSTFIFTPDPDSSERTLGYLPLYLYHVPSKLVLAATIISLIISASGITLVLYARSRGFPVRTGLPFHFSRAHQTPLLSILLSLPAVLSIASIILLYATRAQSAHFLADLLAAAAPGPNSALGYKFYGEKGHYWRGTFALETWACEVASYLRGPFVDPMDSSDEIIDGVCGRERAVRIFMVVLAKVALGVVVMWIWVVRKEGVDMRERGKGGSEHGIRMGRRGNESEDGVE